MIVVRVELWSAITGDKTELARMVIANQGTSDNPRRGDYEGYTLKGRDEAALQSAMVRAVQNPSMAPVSKRGRVENHARLQEHVWNLVGKMLASMGYKTS